MNGSSKPSSERLYLHRDEHDEIYVDSSLHQHHIDGIRFLYRQFKKKTLGVIINNPLGYGNSLQVALFLGAIRHVLDKPILILCKQSEELNWLEHFQKLTQCYNVGVGAPSPFVKKSIFINTMERLELFCRRDWSVMVVDDDDFLKEKTLQAKFKADFKIWISPLNMKDNLEIFTPIYKWLFPKNKVNVEDYKPKPGNCNDTVSKAILLEAFLEDIVCRTTLQTPFENPFEKSDDTPRKASKKNKDATGTKVKRSKRSLDVANTSSTSENSEAGGSAVKVPRTDHTSDDDFTISNFDKKKDKTKDDDKDTKADVESCIRDEQPIRFDPFNEFDNISRNSQEFMDDEPIFDTADRLNRILESNVPMDIAANPECCFMDSDSNSGSLLPIPKTLDDTSQVSNDSDYGDVDRTTPDFLADKVLNDVLEESRNFAKFKDTVKVKENEDNTFKEPDRDRKSPDNINEEGEDDGKRQKPARVNGKPEDSDKIKEDEKNESDKVKESPSKSNLDDKIREMDERAFKKFQGSILDSLF